MSFRILPVVYGVTVSSLLLCKLAEHWNASRGFKGFHLIRVLLRDQLIYSGL